MNFDNMVKSYKQNALLHQNIFALVLEILLRHDMYF